MMDPVDRDGLADFLLRRRESLQPADVGLPPGARRRTPGLRREEVATLAGMSTDYYTRMEQQRAPQPSDQMLTALTRALRLSLDERDHLFRLAGHQPPPRSRRSGHVAPALLRVLDRLLDTPALVVDDLGRTLVQNRVAVALLGDQVGHEGLARSGVHRWFTDPDERRVYPERDHAHQSRVQVANLRASLSAGGTDPFADRLVADLLARSEEFATEWARHEVAHRIDDHKTLVHPELGEIEVDCQCLVTENRAQMLLILTAAPGTESAGKLRLLDVVAV